MGSKRWKRFRVTAADHQPRGRFRFNLVGTSSWFWGIDDFTIYGTPIDAGPVRLVPACLRADGLELEWTGPAGPYLLEFQPGLNAGSWEGFGDPLPATQHTVTVPLSGPAGFFRIRPAP